MLYAGLQTLYEANTSRNAACTVLQRMGLRLKYLVLNFLSL